MSDLPLLPVYLAGPWPAARWFVRQTLSPRRLSGEDQDEAARDASLAAVDDQLRAGADIVSTTLGLPGVTEGMHALARVSGLERLSSRRRGPGRLHSGQPRFQQTKPLVALRGLGIASEARRLLSLTGVTAVATVPGPYTLGGLIHGTQSRLATANTLSPIIRAEIESLATAGVAAVQLDEWGMANSSDDASTLADLVRRTVDGIPIEVHLRLGYLDTLGRATGRRRYRPWLPELTSAVVAATLNVRQFDLAFGAAELAEIDVLADLPSRRIGLGVVDVTCNWVEPPALLVERLKQAVQHTQVERLWISADASLAGLTRAVAVRKVNSMVEAARAVRADFGVREATAPAPEVTPEPAAEKSDEELVAGDMAG